MKNVSVIASFIVVLISGLSCYQVFEPPGNDDENPNSEYTRYPDKYLFSTQGPGAVVFISGSGQNDWLSEKELKNPGDSSAISIKSNLRIRSIPKSAKDYFAHRNKRTCGKGICLLFAKCPHRRDSL